MRAVRSSIPTPVAFAQGSEPGPAMWSASHSIVRRGDAGNFGLSLIYPFLVCLKKRKE